MTRPTPPIDRMIRRFEIDHETGCWIYLGNGVSGYGRIFVRELGKSVMTHRVAYGELVEPIPDDMVIDHLCRVTKCFNPDHLEVVSSVVNVMRGIGPTATNATKTHCKRGHEFTPENTYVLAPSPSRTNPGRSCRECALTRARAKYAENAA